MARGDDWDRVSSLSNVLVLYYRELSNMEPYGGPHISAVALELLGGLRPIMVIFQGSLFYVVPYSSGVPGRIMPRFFGARPRVSTLSISTPLNN